MFSREKIAALVAEFLGTATLVIAVYSMAARTSFPLFAGLAAGLTLGLMVLVIGAFSGAQLNPAVTLGLWSARKNKTLTSIVYIAAQMLGGLAAWALLKYFLGHNLDNLAGQKFEWKVFIAEAVGAAVFLFGVTSAVYQKYEGGKLAFAAGASLTIGILVATMASNGLLNPAVAVGLQSWNWAYAAGPLVGAVIGANLYSLLFAADYPAIRIVAASAAKPKKPAVKAAKTVAKTAKKPARSVAKKRR